METTESVMSQRFDVAWPRRYLERRKHSTWLVEAVLLERKLVAGRPSLQLVCRLACIDEDRTGEIAAQEKFWYDARARLGRLSRLSDRDLDEIEALLAKRIPRPAPANATPTARPSAHPIRGPHQPLLTALRAR
jgi:hypothetical protein